MTLTPVSGGGLAEMTYSTNGGDDQIIAGEAATTVWYQAGEPVVGYMKIDFPALYLFFGIDPFTGPGSYTQLPYLMYIDPSVLGPDCHGFWTTAPDGPAPVLDVTSFTVSSDVTLWASTLTAALVWYVEDCEQPPLDLNVSTLTLTIHSSPAPSDALTPGFDTYVPQQAAELARRFGVSSFPG
jgi:hypothetical protein